MDDYQQFRKRTMGELTREFPEKTYREKMKIVGERWKQTKITQLVRMNIHELMTEPLGDQYLKRFKYTIVDIGPAEFIELVDEESGQSSLMRILSRILRETRPGTRFLGIIQKFFLFKGFYELRLHDLDFLDICCLHFRYDFVYCILETIPARWKNEIILERKDRLSSLMNVFLFNVFDEELRYTTLEILRKLMLMGLDPNLELTSPISEYTASYEDSFTRGMREEGMDLVSVRDVLRYVGINPNNEYRLKLLGSRYVQDLDVFRIEESESNKLVGDTVFSVFLQNSRNQKNREFSAVVLRTGVVYTNALLHPYRYREDNSPKTYLTISLLSGSLKHLDVLSSILFETTPPYMFYVGDVYPMNLAMKNIKTCWNGFLKTSPDSAPVIARIVTGGFCIPRDDFFWKIHMQRGFVEHVREGVSNLFFRRREKPVFENILEECELRDMDPMKTCLAQIILYPSVLKRILSEGMDLVKNQTFILRAFQAHQTETLKKIRELCEPLPNGENYINDTFLMGDEYVKDSQKIIFRTEDDYAFESSEWPFLLQKKHNPYTRRELTEREVERIKGLRSIVHRNWVVLSQKDIPFSTHEEEPSDKKLVDLYVSKIDEYLDATQLITYGVRLRDHVQKLEKPGVVRAFFELLNTHPGLAIDGEDVDTTFADWCVPLFHHSASSDPGDLEEISIYYGLRLYGTSSSDPTRELIDVLGYVYNVLETMYEYGKKDRFIGKCLSVYYVIENYLRRI